jgi:hypothetical protein
MDAEQTGMPAAALALAPVDDRRVKPAPLPVTVLESDRDRTQLPC